MGVEQLPSDSNYFSLSLFNVVMRFFVSVICCVKLVTVLKKYYPCRRQDI